MLVKLLPGDIAKYWENIKEAIEATIPQEYLKTHERLNHILDNLLLDAMQAWWVVTGPDILPKVVGLMITTIFNDNAIRADVLRLYVLFAYEPIPEEEWSTGFRTLEKFALSRGCVQMESFTANERLLERARNMGWNTDMTHIYKELTEELEELS